MRTCYEVVGDGGKTLKDGFTRREDAERWIDNQFSHDEIQLRNIAVEFGEWPEER